MSPSLPPALPIIPDGPDSPDGPLRSGALGGVKTWRKLHELRAQGVSAEEIFADPVSHLGEEGRILGADFQP